MLRRMREGVREFPSVRGGGAFKQQDNWHSHLKESWREGGHCMYVCTSVLCMCVSVGMIVRLSQCVFASGRHCNHEK